MATVYSGSSAYSGSSGNLSRISFDSDNVFSDGVDTQMATIGGSLAAGYTASLQVAISEKPDNPLRTSATLWRLCGE